MSYCYHLWWLFVRSDFDYLETTYSQEFWRMFSPSFTIFYRTDSLTNMAVWSLIRGSNVIGKGMRNFGMCFQYGGQSSPRTKTVSIVFLIIHICIDAATSRISRFGGKTCPVYIHTQYVSSKWVFQKLLSKFHRKIVAFLRTSLITRIDRLYSSYIGPYLLVSLHFIIN